MNGSDSFFFVLLSFVVSDFAGLISGYYLFFTGWRPFLNLGFFLMFLVFQFLCIQAFSSMDTVELQRLE